MSGGRVGFVDFIVLVFYVHREVMRGLEEADSWIVKSAGQGSDGRRGRPKCLVTIGRIGDNCLFLRSSSTDKSTFRGR